ncbi:hypothetical protein T05_14156 [Trichinella murrelli]|uniref:Uncharacterized protein n=1 Tax=Trichinella murrelli TaxID=144512 RepID=A0A0V0TGI9_9BILA|nr:hypothetical protein T05_14156 [Trichinella murrelli]
MLLLSIWEIKQYMCAGLVKFQKTFLLMQVCYVFPYESAVKQAVHYHSFSFNAMCYCLYCLEAYSLPDDEMVVSDCLGPFAFEFVGWSSSMLANDSVSWQFSCVLLTLGSKIGGILLHGVGFGILRI